jgi:hypothetical protein
MKIFTKTITAKYSMISLESSTALDLQSGNERLAAGGISVISRRLISAGALLTTNL